MNIQQFRALTPDARSEAIFSQLHELRVEITTIHEEISHFRELEKTRKKLRSRRARESRESREMAG